MKIIVLAAGYATRLFPLTKNRAKPLLDVGGRPVLSWIMDRVLTIPKIEEVVVVSNRRFVDQYRDWAREFAGGIPIRILDDGSISDDDKLGATGDLAFAFDSIEEADEYLVIGGDNLIDFDLAPFARRFRESDRHPMLLVRKIEGELAPARYNEITLDDDGEVTRFREKPLDPQSPLSSLCLYFFPRELPTWIRSFLAGGGDPDAPGYFIEWLSKETRLEVARCDGIYFDIGGFDTLEAARSVFARTRELES